MPNVGDLLERESRTVDLAPGDFDRLLDRRERKARQRRVAAGAVAALVMLVTLGLLMRSFTTVPVDPPAPLLPGPLAYTAHGDLIVADWDGQHPVTILDGRADEGCAEEYYSHGPEIWSPDGRYLAVRRAPCRDGATQDEIVIVQPNGEVVGEFPAEGWEISWSPDATRVASWMSFPRSFGVWDVHGDLVTEIPAHTRLLPHCDCDAFWSADGSSLAASNGVVIPLDGSRPYRLPDDDLLSNEDAVVSPDGSRVAYVEEGRLFVAAADGSDPRPLASAFVQDPIWSPSGDLIAYAQDPIDPPEIFEVRIVDVETGEVTRPIGMGGTNSFWPVEFSADGEKILIRRSDHELLEPAMWISNADGSAARPLVAASVGDWGPV